MPSVWDSIERTKLVERALTLTAATPAQWGRFDATRMLSHVNDGIRMALGDLAVARRPGPLRLPPLKQLIIWVLPFPKGAPTAPELLARGSTAEFQAELSAFRTLVSSLEARQSQPTWPEHPAFGTMSRDAWGHLIHKHVDHHFKQFGV